MKTQVQFDVVYNPALVNQIGDLMSKLDLGIDGLQYPHGDRITYTTTTKVTKKYLKFMNEKIREAYEKQGHTVFSINLVKTIKESKNEKGVASSRK